MQSNPQKGPSKKGNGKENKTDVKVFGIICRIFKDIKSIAWNNNLLYGKKAINNL